MAKLRQETGGGAPNPTAVSGQEEQRAAESGGAGAALGFLVLEVAGLDASVGFYRDRLGLRERVRRTGFVEFETGSVGLALHQAREGLVTRGLHLLFVVEDIDAAVREFAARGVTFDGPPADQPWEGGARVATARDPDGNRVSFLAFPRSGGPRVEVFEGDILDVCADALVNAANTQLRHGGGVAAAIAGAAGPELVAESERAGFCPLGQAVATTAGRLPARRVIHVPTIDYTTGRRATPADITAGTRAALEICRREGLRRVALPLLGAGVAGLPPERVVAAMRDAWGDFGDLEVVVCAHSPSDRAAVRAVLGEKLPTAAATPPDLPGSG
jgi:O-acetyl-ADP-ribose deacetylase (regulator of RNase III)/predicted enzyme related to lactoylglutathione lyase